MVLYSTIGHTKVEKARLRTPQLRELKTSKKNANSLPDYRYNIIDMRI
jgi:hypothetical protein